MAIERIADPSFWLGMAFITCIFVAMACGGFMCISAKWAKGGFLFLPWESNSLIQEFKRRFPESVIYKIFSVAAIGSAVLAGILLTVVLWADFAAR